LAAVFFSFASNYNKKISFKTTAQDFTDSAKIYKVLQANPKISFSTAQIKNTLLLL